MSKNSLPVIAAIPNYNMAHGLSELLPQVAQQNYAEIFVLDDASTDYSRETVNNFDRSIHFVAGLENVGAGANRNRIIKALGALGLNAIIHFIDADMNLETQDVPELAQEVASSDAIGFVGGLIKEPSGRQHPFNYGPRQCLRTNLASHLQTYICAIGETDPERAKELRVKHHDLLQDWPDPLVEPQPRRIFWTAEANFFIRSEVLEDIGGFDPQLREHEIQDLAIKLSNRGLEQRFDPALAALHKAIVVRSGNRSLQMARAEWQIARKHGLLKWLMPNGKFRPTP